MDSLDKHPQSSIHHLVFDTSAKSIPNSSASRQGPSWTWTALSSTPAVKRRLTNCKFLPSVLECYMTLQMQKNKSLRSGGENHEPTVFHSLQPPSITPVAYFRRITQYALCSSSAYILAFWYLQEIARVQPCLAIDSANIHRLLLTANLLAAKVLEDVVHNNAHFAKVGGVHVKELNMLELDMLRMLRFQLWISAEKYEAFEHSILNEVLSSDDPQFLSLQNRIIEKGYSFE